jgi:hypothetical protein
MGHDADTLSGTSMLAASRTKTGFWRWLGQLARSALLCAKLAPLVLMKGAVTVAYL